MTDVAIVLVGAALGTIALKAAGPVLLGGRPLPPGLDGVVALAGPALLGALVAVSTFADGQDLVVDARVVGVAAAAVAIHFRAPALVVVIIAAVTAGLAQAITG